MILLFKVNSRHPFLIAQQVIDILIIRKRLRTELWTGCSPSSVQLNPAVCTEAATFLVLLVSNKKESP